MVFDTPEENRFSSWQSTKLRKDNADKTTKVLQANDKQMKEADLSSVNL